MDTPKSIFLMVLGVTYGLIFNLSIFHPAGMDQPKPKILIQDFMSEGGGKLEGGAFSPYLPFLRKCPGFALALIDNVFLQQYNPPFCFYSYSCKLRWWLEGLSSCCCRKGSCSVSWRSLSFDKYFLFFFFALNYVVLFVSTKLHVLPWFCCAWPHCYFVYAGSD